MKILILLFSLAIAAFAKNNISINEILRDNFSQKITIEKKNLILKKEEVKEIQQRAKAKVLSKIVRFYTVNSQTEVLGYGILLRQKIRTKNAVIFYIIDNKKKLKSIEIVSFHEPLEYKPDENWLAVFKEKNSEDFLIAGKDIPTISGATLSARAISDTARLALAILEVKKP